MSGLINKIAATPGVFVEAATIPANVNFGTVTLNILNIGSEQDQVSVAISLVDPPTDADLVEYMVPVAANGGALIRSCELVSPNEKIFIKSEVSNQVIVRVSGVFEMP